MFGDNLVVNILSIILFVFSVVVHEFAHGWAALRAGDPTAKLMGRLTLNPIPHIDLFGSILIPAFLIFSGSSFLFAYAKPVPVNPNNFRNYRKDEINVSFAGPASNLALSFIFLILSIMVASISTTSQLSIFIIQIFQNGIFLNLILAFFNLIPIPPLDGSHILENYLPPQYTKYFAMIRPYGFMILIFLLILTPLFKIIFIPIRIINEIYMQLFDLFV